MLSAPDRWPAASAGANPSRSTARCRASNGARRPPSDLRICQEIQIGIRRTSLSGTTGSAGPATTW